MTDIRAVWTVAEASMRNAKTHFAAAMSDTMEVVTEAAPTWFQRVVLNHPAGPVTRTVPMTKDVRVELIDDTLQSLRQALAATDQLGSVPGVYDFGRKVRDAERVAMSVQSNVTSDSYLYSHETENVLTGIGNAESIAHQSLISDVHASVAPRVAGIVTGVQRELSEIGVDHFVRDKVLTGTQETLRAIHPGRPS